MANYGVKIRLIGESDYTGWIFADGACNLSSGSNPGDPWQSGLLVDVSPVGETVDIAQGGNYAEVADVVVTVAAVGYRAFATQGYSIIGAEIEVGRLTGSTYARAWLGTVVDAQQDGVEVAITCESITTTRHREIPLRRLTSAEFPALPSDAERLPVPICYGPVERMTPKSIRAPRYLPTTYVVRDGVISEWYQVGNVIPPGATASDVGIPTLFVRGSSVLTPEEWLVRFISGERVFVEIVSGTGSGQSRSIASINIETVSTSDGVSRCVIECTMSTPWGTVPDGTSVIAIYSLSVAEKLVVCDEGIVDGVYVDAMNATTPIPCQQTESDGIVFADVSGEFRNGENYESIKYVAPVEVWGVSALNDLDASIPGSPSGVAFAPANQAVLGSPFGDVFIVDALCKAKIFCTDYPPGAESSRQFFALVSLKLLSMPAWVSMADLRIAVAGERFGAADDVLIVDPRNPITGDKFNSFSSSFVDDGGALGNFAAYRAEVTMPLPLSSYSSIRVAAVFYPTSGSQPLRNTCTVDSAPYSGGNTIDIYPAAAGYFYLGDRIRPALCLTDDTLNNSGFYRVRGGFSEYIGGPTNHLSDADRNWRTVDAITAITIRGVSGFRITLDDEFVLPADGERWRLVTTAALDLSAYEAECGFAFGFGEITPDTTFLADLTSGRADAAAYPDMTPITLADEAAVDILYRDLGLTNAEIDDTSFQALPENGIAMILHERESSAKIMARMCREYNWIIAHSPEGKERATAWLERLWEASEDWTVTNAQIVEGSIQGPRLTALEDAATLLRVQGAWTQADGFRSIAEVIDLSIDPDDLTEANYLRYIVGFGDLEESRAIYARIHAAYAVTRSAESLGMPYLYVQEPAALVTGPLLEWITQRKTLLDFRVSEAHAINGATLGDRVKVTHRRYAPAGAHGTLVARYWHPADGQTQCVVMLDPAEYVPPEEEE